MNKVYRILFLAMFALGASQVFAQVQDETTPGYDFSSPDSTQTDSAVSDEAQPEDGAKVNPLLKPYERIVLYIDSNTNLITYYGVVEQEESGSDSLYMRAKRWATKKFGKEVKIEVDKRNQKLTYVGSIPAYVYMNQFTKRNVGKFEFKLTLLIKEGRYKYQISNLVHESYKPSDGSKPTRNYFEFYYTSNTKVREYDTILRNADKDIQKLIADLMAYLKEPPVVDEDDW